jgi:cytochrome P450
MATPRPELAIDLYSDEAIRDPHPLYRAIRDRAPAVWLPAHDVWAVGRFEDVRAALRADTVLVSGRGVALNDLVNGQPAATTLTSDGELHRSRRAVVIRPMLPKALAEVRAEIELLASEAVAELLARGPFCGVADFARRLPVAVVSRLVGLPEAGRERMLDWAKAVFDVLGPWNARAQASVAPFLEMAKYATELARETLAPTGWAARMFAAADGGELAGEDVRGLLIDYIAPSLDTTILGTGHLLYLLGSHPEQYERVRADPEAVPGAVHEALRFESPVRAFTRYAVSDYDAGGVVIPKGERALILYGSANRDERRYADPDRFDVGRDARDHVAFGYGVHRCAGGFLAQLEMEALLRALTAHVRTIEVGEPTWLVSNVLRGYAAFPATFHG